MRSAVLRTPGPLASSPLRIESLPRPRAGPGEVLLRVRACGVCRTDLHIVEGELPPRRAVLVPGHQIVGEIAACGDDVTLPVGSRVGVSWLGGVDGTCEYCLRGEENLCDAPLFTGYDIYGGYAEYAVARADFAHELPAELDDIHAAPLLCAGVIGFRALRVAGVQPYEKVGLYGFGASAHLVLPVLLAWGCRVYVATRGEVRRALALRLGAHWVGEATNQPPEQLDRAVTFAPAGEVVIAALGALRKGGVVAINAIHLDRMPAFDYDSLLWGERQIRSVTNMTRTDARDFLSLAAEIHLRPEVTAYPLERVQTALTALKEDKVSGAVALVP